MWVYQAMAFLNLCEFIFHFIRTAPYSLTTKSLCDCTALNFQGQLVHIWKELQIFVNTWNLWSTSAFFDKGNICTHDCSLYDHHDQTILIIIINFKNTIIIITVLISWSSSKLWRWHWWQWRWCWTRGLMAAVEQTWDLSKNLHDRIFRPKILHTNST